MRSFANIANHISQHGAFYLQDIDLLFMLDQSVHNHCILGGAVCSFSWTLVVTEKSEVLLLWMDSSCLLRTL
jgi:hypothetical protein